MRKEKRGHARGTDDRGRAGARGRPRYDVDATGWRGQWKRKRMGGSAEKDEETARCQDGEKLGGGLRELERRKRFKRFLIE
jgi:hypothetical protein